MLAVRIPPIYGNPGELAPECPELPKGLNEGIDLKSEEEAAYD